METQRARRLSRSDWLAKALDALQAKGIEAVSINALAQELGVTKGSFYWHFENRQELLDELLDFWDELATDTVIEYVEGLDVDATSKLLALMEYMQAEEVGRFELAVRAWAQYDSQAAIHIRAVEKKRLRYATGLFLEAGYDPTEARARARLFLDYMNGVEASHVLGEHHRSRAMVRLHHRILTS